MGRITRRARLDVIEPGQLIVTISPQPFLYPSGHPNRAANCLICQHALAGHPAVLVTAAEVDVGACSCSAVCSRTFLMHSFHGQPATWEMEAALTRGLQCPEFHYS